MDARHQKRIAIVQELYASRFTDKGELSPRAQAVINNKTVIEDKVRAAAPKYQLSKIAPVDLAILELAIYELLIEKKEPPKVIINEAVELAHELAGEKAPGFVNAVLGKIYKEIDHG